MDIRKLQKIVVSALEDIKGEDIEVINTTKLTSLFDRIVIATGNSNRQVKALANNVVVKVKEAGGEVVSSEGEDGGEWVLVDLGDIVVHVMQANVRAYYNLEELWQAKPAGAKKGKAADDEDGDSPAPKRSRAVKTSAKETPAAAKPARKAPAKTAAGAAPKTASKATPTRRRKVPAAE
ncbi:hypothetical protein DLREEDagrD3_12290 [Denitratisoma sp. agr-D3]